MALASPPTRALVLAALIAGTILALTIPASAQEAGPQMTDSRLGVRSVASGFELPTGIAFLGANDFLVTEKATGRVKRVVGGTVQATPLDLDVNNFSERGLLGIALHPQFPANPGVYLYWTESTASGDTNVPSATPLL